MDEAESKESVHKAEQTESRSLIIKAEEEEATAQRGHLGDLSAGQEDVTNGLTSHDSQEAPVTSVCSPGTSYWCVTENTDTPFLLSPIPGPSTQEPPPFKLAPGRDHRRYYHEYWRSEYLMDFDPQRQGMICMVCGSSLATLKLSTIKRHIKQRHPYSLLWTESDKDVIRSGWESHLSRDDSQRPLCPDPDVPPESEEILDVDRHSTGKPGGAVSPVPQAQSEFSRVTPSPPASPVQELEGPTAQVMERYLNDSLHAWFRQEFLMEYQAEEGRLVCMVCSCLLPSLHLDHIKSHMLDLHPNSLLYTAEEKHSILQTWAKMHGEESHSLQPQIKSEPLTKEINVDGSASFFPLNVDPIQGNLGSYTRGDENPPDTGQRSQSLPYYPRKRRLKYGSPWRLRLDYLVAYGPPDNPLCYCMVCSEHLPVPRVSNFRKHIQECHPETSGLSRGERDAVVSAWTKEESIDTATLKGHDPKSGPVTTNTAVDTQVSPVKTTEQGGETEDSNSTNTTPSTQTTGRHRHYPGKDQRRNYQARWKMDFLMDYDCSRHGLICMVCGATLATLKVSTIKRHILQVHPHSLDYSPEERQLALLCYNQISVHFHSEDCFSGSNHGHKENANGNAYVNAECTSSQST
ncbi:zinc finger translocation-associated protein isoform X1 [Rhinichthys klamathensis goyatoka]|uniref:zinc finger translocation-associated protein isoform X1 n=1 Tax=Rhinichthys klamathensis goyatoka TaxID=3034132 RepID=UPI0024B539BD|nr:zinc finger translocation-associated protein isoform X1 [Rhinichthys klamathensis goyatoka]